MSALRPACQVRRHRVGQCGDAFAGQCAELGFEDHGLVPRPHHVVVIAAPVESAVDPAGEFFARTGIEYVVEILEYGEGAGYDGVRAERLEDVDLSGKVQVEGGSAATDPAGDVLDGDSRVSAFGEERAGGIHEVCAGSLLLLLSQRQSAGGICHYQDPSAAGGALTGQLHETLRLSLDSPLVKATLWCSAHSTDQRTP